MDINDICHLPIKEIADDNCILFIWGTWPKLLETIKVIESWGFKYRTSAFVWAKTNKSENVEQGSFFPIDAFSDFFGMGYYKRANTEYCLLATKGKPKPICSSVKQLIFSPLRQHSRKPEETKNRIVELMGDLPRIELFAREKTEGWDVWGNQIESSLEFNMVRDTANQ